MSNSAIIAGKALIELGILDNTEKEMQGVNAKLQGIGGSITSFGAKVAAGGFGLMAMFVKPLQYAAELQDSMAMFETMLGSAEKAERMLSRIREMAAKTPFETSDLTNATQMLLAFSVPAEDVLRTMQMLGDASSGNSQRFESLARAYGKVASATRLSGDEVNMFIDAGWNPLQTIAEKTGETMIQVRKRMEQGAIGFKEVQDALTSVTSEGGRFFGMMDKQSQTLFGRLSTLKDAVVMALTPIGEAIAPIAGGMLWLASKIVEAFATVSPYLTWVYQGIFLLGVAAAAVSVPIMAFGASLFALGAAVIPLALVAFKLFSIHRFFSTVLPLTGKFGQALAVLLNPLSLLKKGLSGFVFSASGAMTALSFIPGPVGIIVTIVQTIGELGKAVSVVFPAAGGFVARFLSVWGRIAPAFRFVSTAFTGFGALITPLLSLALGPIGVTAQMVARFGLAARVASAATSLFSGPLGRILMLFGRMLSVFPMVGGVVGILSGPIGLLVSAIGILAYLFWDDLKPAFDWLMGAVSEVFTKLADAFARIKDVFGNMFGKMLKDLGELYNKAKQFIGLGESPEEKAAREEEEAIQKEEAERVARSNREQAEADKAFQQDGPEAAKRQTFATFSARSAMLAGQGMSGEKGVKGAVEKGNGIAQDSLDVQRGAAANQEKLARMFKFG